MIALNRFPLSIDFPCHALCSRQYPLMEAKLFKNGQSQAVRLPKQFRFEGKAVSRQKINPLFPALRLFQEPPAKSKFLAVPSSANS